MLLHVLVEVYQGFVGNLGDVRVLLAERRRTLVVNSTNNICLWLQGVIEDTEQVVVHQHLATAMGSRSNTDCRNMDTLRENVTHDLRNTFQNDRKASSLLESFCIFDQLHHSVNYRSGSP